MGRHKNEIWVICVRVAWTESPYLEPKLSWMCNRSRTVSLRFKPQLTATLPSLQVLMDLAANQLRSRVKRREVTQKQFYRHQTAQKAPGPTRPGVSNSNTQGQHLKLGQSHRPTAIFIEKNSSSSEQWTFSYRPKTVLLKPEYGTRES